MFTSACWWWVLLGFYFVSCQCVKFLFTMIHPETTWWGGGIENMTKNTEIFEESQIYLSANKTQTNLWKSIFAEKEISGNLGKISFGTLFCGKINLLNCDKKSSKINYTVKSLINRFFKIFFYADSWFSRISQDFSRFFFTQLFFLRFLQLFFLHRKFHLTQKFSRFFQDFFNIS